ncbi:heterokaryon incompatibility protein-domain-containing protein [Nemania abortiva]|nr:heterokaryon incompatibility protein-domain-containing protein [Nemania abortiva]
MMEYKPLTNAQIRLLTIEPGKIEDDIQCSLTIVSLDDKLKYEALSYVWGDPTIMRDIFVKVLARTDKLSRALRRLHLRGRPDRGVVVPVTRNLFTVLHRFRPLDKCRTMWVDALCINQQDPDECSWQVLLMNRIYSQLPDRYAVFLHPEFPDFEFCPQEYNARLSLINICSRDWRRRTWTVQEAILPENCVINIGSHQFPLWHFLSTALATLL